MLRYNRKSVPLKALLGMGVALGLVFCVLLGPMIPGLSLGADSAAITSHAIEGTNLNPCELSGHCELALSGNPPPVKAPLASMAVPAVRDFPSFHLFQPSRAVLHAAPTVLTPHHASLRHQEVLFRI